MKLSHLFWGILLVTVGLLFFINNFSPIYFDWASVIRLWPLAFVLWGISVILKDNKIVRGIFVCLISLVLALLIFSTIEFLATNVSNGFDFDNGITFSTDDSSYSNVEKYNLSYSPDIKYAKLKLDGGAGIFKIHEETDNLFDARAYGYRNKYNLMQNDEDSTAEITFEMKKIRFHFNNNANEANIRLNPNPIWNLDCNVGAANVNFDLAPYKIRNFDLSMGAARLKLRLGDSSSTTNVKIDGGAAKIEIYVPRSSGCEIHSESFLSSKHFDGFEKVRSGTYRTSNFYNSEKKIYIRFSTGVTSINVKRY